MAASFKPVESEEDLRTLARLADEIWHEYWPAIIGRAQTDYMVERFQSLPAIKKSVAEQGYRYWLIVDDACASDRSACVDASDSEWGADGIVGYTGGCTEPDTNRFFISKIYLLEHARGRGYCSKTIEFYDDLCRAERLHAMYLTVNKRNEMGIRAYRAKGFETIDSVETDIGKGFVMDDFVMEKPVFDEKA